MYAGKENNTTKKIEDSFANGRAKQHLLKKIEAIRSFDVKQ